MKKIIIGIVFSIISSLQFCLKAQEIDSLNQATKHQVKIRPSQEYEFSDGTTRSYSKPKFFEIITKIPSDFIATNVNFITKDHAWYLGGAVASTALLVPVDQQITNYSRDLSERNGFSADNRYSKKGPFKIPENIGAGFYLVGNGSTIILLGVGFASYGLLKNDYRAQATASELVESLILSGVFSQTVKRVTGRESPFIARENGNPGGDWNPFPSFSAFATQTPHYDAMPSGHLMTIMAGMTIITTNYPEYKWVKPVGYALIAGMSYQMIQSEVHWTSDYPMALFMGYFIGKTIAKNRFKETKKDETTEKKYTYQFSASKQYGINTVGVTVTF